ncbi:MAG: hypothetical protein Q7R41_16340 [Phycisphaerales bacterium]|nr:hypothetical protein [Phycisphaerales bacterium]
MSTSPKFSLWEKRHEMNGARKGTIYLAKIGLGAAVSVPFALLSVPLGVFVSVAFLTMTKAVYYLRYPARPLQWDIFPDWLCDMALTLGWYAALSVWADEPRIAAWIFGAWLISYPFSCE